MKQLSEELQAVIVPLQIGVVFNNEIGLKFENHCYRPLTNRGSL
mgnify:CR=1